MPSALRTTTGTEMINVSSHGLLNRWILSHAWELAYNEKRSIGVIARYKCKMCGMEIVHIISAPKISVGN